MKKTDLVVWKYYTTGMKQRVKLMSVGMNTMELMYSGGIIRTTPMSKSILDYVELSESQKDDYIRASNIED